jgi:ubiquinone biosynthesis protein
MAGQAVTRITTFAFKMQQQQKRSWIFGSMIAILLSIAIISPWFVSIPLIVVASLIALWRIVR